MNLKKKTELKLEIINFNFKYLSALKLTMIFFCLQVNSGRQESRNTPRTSQWPKTSRWRWTARPRDGPSRRSSGFEATRANWCGRRRSTPSRTASSCPAARSSSCGWCTARGNRTAASTGVWPATRPARRDREMLRSRLLVSTVKVFCIYICREITFARNPFVFPVRAF